MSRNDYNTDFLSYNGTINRKNYIINMLILICLFTGISFINFDNIINSSPFKFLSYVFDFIIYTFKFVIFFSAVSLIYRRFADIVKEKSQKTKEIAKKIFMFLYIFPVLYLFCMTFLFESRPALLAIPDLIIIFIILPLGILTSVITAFIK